MYKNYTKTYNNIQSRIFGHKKSHLKRWLKRSGRDSLYFLRILANHAPNNKYSNYFEILTFCFHSKMLINSKHFCTPFCTLFVYLTMKQKVRFILKNPSAVSSTAINMLYSWGYKDSNGKYKNLW
mgnify:CR=1 FL=1